MAIKIELERALVERALEACIASLLRSKNSAKNPLFIPIIDVDLKKFTDAKNTLSEIK